MLMTKKTTTGFIAAITLLAFISCTPSGEEKEAAPFIKGVYGNPGSLLDAGYSFDSLGMNAVFVRSISLNREFYEAARDQGCKVFVEFPTLLGRNYVDNHPDAWPIDEKGEQADIADWFMGVCPTNPGFREHRAAQLRDILTEFDVDGIFLDYLHWHAQFETPDPILPETCFCDNCTALFQEYSGIKLTHDDIPGKAGWILTNVETEWRKWRNSIINMWVDDMREVINTISPGTLLGVFYCSWYPSDHNSALYRILGIDVRALAERVDVLSPMLFHMMKDRPAGWVGEYVDWLGRTTGAGTEGKPQIWPIVQAHNNPGIITPEEFRQVMLEGSRPPASGIMMFSDVSLLDDPLKITVMKELYTEGEFPPDNRGL